MIPSHPRPLTTLLGMSLAAACMSTFAASLPGPLVDSQWLKEHLNDKDIVIVDVRKRDDFTKFGFVPGARWWDWDTVRVDRKVDGVEVESVVPTTAQFEALMRGLNLQPSTPIVIVSQGDSASAFTQGTRVYWTLKYFGHNQVALLDGGMAKWTAEQNDTRPIPDAVRTVSNYRVKAVHNEILAKTADVQAAVRTQSTQLLDARAPEYFLGKSKKDFVSARGHIPGAKLFANSLLLDPKTKALRSAGDLRDDMSKAGIDPSKPLIAYCDSGHLSTGAWFVAHELLGNPQVRVYDGSMHEWTLDQQRPVSTAP